MALVNHAKKEINAKIVFYGPASSGKSTLMKSICSKLPNEIRGPLRSMGMQRDRMLFFDFTHPDGTDTDCYSVRFHVYTLTGAVSHEQAWKMVLKGVDGIAFVADSDPARQDENRHLLYQMKSALSSYGKGLEELSFVTLCTKQDILTSLSPEHIRQDLSDIISPALPLTSTAGDGTMQGMSLLLDGILSNLESLGLALQTSVNMLRHLAPAILESDVLSNSHAEKDDSRVLCQQLATGNTDTTNRISFGGSPEISSDGALIIPVVASCCGKKSTITIKISMQ